MKKMRETYGIFYVNLVESAWKPNLETVCLDIPNLPKNYIRVKTSNRGMLGLDPIQIKTFKNREEFTKHIIEQANDAWDMYENAKNFEKTLQDIANRIKEIKSRNAGGWEPYQIMREVMGVDLISTPDMESEKLNELIENRPDAANNNGIFRRVKR